MMSDDAERRLEILMSS